MRRRLLIAVALGGLACGGSRPETMRSLAEMQEISAQKDSLLKDVTATSAFLAEVGRELGRARDLKSGRPVAGHATDLEDASTPAQRRARIVAQVQELVDRVNTAEARLATSRRRVAELTGSDAAKSARLAAFDSTIASFRALIESQRSEIVSLGEQVRALTDENTALTNDNARLVSAASALTSARDSMTTESNTVYYVVDSRRALIDHHVIEQTGGFLGLGKTQVPARELDRSAFVPIDKTQVTEIPLPDASKSYRVITRQDLAALETAPDGQGRVSGSLRIKDPRAFWAASRYLIVVEQ